MAFLKYRTRKHPLKYEGIFWNIKQETIRYEFQLIYTTNLVFTRYISTHHQRDAFQCHLSIYNIMWHYIDYIFRLVQLLSYCCQILHYNSVVLRFYSFPSGFVVIYYWLPCCMQWCWQFVVQRCNLRNATLCCERQCVVHVKTHVLDDV